MRQILGKGVPNTKSLTHKPDLKQMKQKRLDAQTMRDSLIHFSQIVEAITFTPTEIEIALFDQMIGRGL